MGQGGGVGQEGERGGLAGENFIQRHHKEGKILDEVIGLGFTTNVIVKSVL